MSQVLRLLITISTGTECTNHSGAGVIFMWRLIQDHPSSTIQNNQDDCRIPNSILDQQVFTLKLPAGVQRCSYSVCHFECFLLILEYLSLCLHHMFCFSDWLRAYPRKELGCLARLVLISTGDGGLCSLVSATKLMSRIPEPKAKVLKKKRQHLEYGVYHDKTWKLMNW